MYLIDQELVYKTYNKKNKSTEKIYGPKKNCEWPVNKQKPKKCSNSGRANKKNRDHLPLIVFIKVSSQAISIVGKFVGEMMNCCWKFELVKGILDRIWWPPGKCAYPMS